MDHHISHERSLYHEFTCSYGKPWDVLRCAPLTHGQWSQRHLGMSASLLETHVFTARIMNEFSLAWVSDSNNAGGTRNPILGTLSIFARLATSPDRGRPTSSTSGYYTTRDHDEGTMDSRLHGELLGNLTDIPGRQIFEAGVNNARFEVWFPSPSGPLETFILSGQWMRGKAQPGRQKSKGHAFADFLDGSADSTGTCFASAFRIVYSSWDDGYYEEGTWQAIRSLTFSYGSRHGFI